MLLCADVWALAGQFGNQAGGGGGALCVGTGLTQRWGGGWKSGTEGYHERGGVYLSWH